MPDSEWTPWVGRALALVLFGHLFCGCVVQRAARPPFAPVRPHQSVVHGQARVDNYYWLNDRADPDVISYLEAENTYTAALMKHTEPLQERLYDEFVGRIKETDQSVPAKKGDYYYYTRTQEGKQYKSYCRKRGSLEATEEVLLEANELAQGHEYFRIGVFEVSPDHRLLAFATDTTGSEAFTLRVKDLTTGQLLPDEMVNIYYSCEWGNDNRTLFYTTLDEAKRPDKVFRHRLGSNQSQDHLVHHERDEAYHVSLSKTRSEKYVLINLRSQVTSEVRFLDADEPAGEFALVQARRHQMEYRVAHHSGRFFMVTNEQAVNFKVVEAPVDQPALANWKDLVSHRPDVKIDRVDAFKSHLVIYERKDGLRQIRVLNLETGDDHYVEFPEPVYTASPGDNREFAATTLRFNYTSLVTPRSVFDYDMDARTRKLMKRDEVLGGYAPANYQSKRIVATAPDGTPVPVSLVYRQGTNLDGTKPLLLYGYGSYGYCIDPTFAPERISLLDRGFICAIAHIRGGGIMGRPWYEDGKLLHKRNTFTDFIACAEHLVAGHYTTSDRLVIMGGSAGGLLMGAVTNLRPDLFRAVVAQVPFVDVVTTMLDASIPLTVIEYEEWGNPNQKPYFDYIRGYSPYDNVAAQAYPQMLITAGLNDPRVGYWEPAKWTAKLRTTKTDHNRLLLKTNMGAGHGGKSGRYSRFEEQAFVYAFILDAVGIGE